MDYMSIIACIPIGRANRITRERLSRITGKTDRINRRAIEEARKAGIPVISSSYDRGYYIAETQEEIDSLLRETWARIRAIILLLCGARRNILISDWKGLEPGYTLASLPRRSRRDMISLKRCRML